MAPSFPVDADCKVKCCCFLQAELKAQGGVLIINRDKDGQAIGAQDLHLDILARTGWTAMRAWASAALLLCCAAACVLASVHAVVSRRFRRAALQEPGAALFLALEDFSLLVVLHSHRAVLSVQAAMAAAAARGEDELAARDDMADTWGDFVLKRVHVKAGHVLLMHGLLVHSGDEGQCGVPAMRAHWYVQQAPLSSDDGVVHTHPLLALGDKLAYKLCFSRSRTA